MLEIAVNNQQKTKPLSARKLGLWVRKILQSLGLKHAKISVTVVDNQKIKHLHRKFLKMDSVTDCLAFGPSKGPLAKTGKPFLGEVVASVEMASRVGPQFGNPWDAELLLYICHGILHLLGYRDSSKTAKHKMDKKQDQVLRKILGLKWQSKKRKRLF